ncbi:hypothetical protein RB195_026114 [Necator americanus]|uniref:Uncharacterized protein n=1 Tax=Necator americanus TaxID=51031 RepID=A0ABR1EVI6_NECAM
MDQSHVQTFAVKSPAGNFKAPVSSTFTAGNFFRLILTDANNNIISDANISSEGTNSNGHNEFREDRASNSPKNASAQIFRMKKKNGSDEKYDRCEESSSESSPKRGKFVRFED